MIWLIVQAHSVPPGDMQLQGSSQEEGSQTLSSNIAILGATYVHAYTAICLAPGGPQITDLDHA